jgi:glyoxylase-like metal-dependent hydrolase (beta-lactamase superfamily II)
MKTLKTLLKCSALSTALAVCPWAQAQSTAEFQRHMEASTRNTGGDPSLVQSWRAFYCNLPDDNNRIVLEQRAKNVIRMPLTMLFDDVWYIGSEYVGTYIIKNERGFVMVDSGNNAQEVETYTVPALRSLGLSASLPLNAVLLTHGHGDHDGGMNYLRTNLGAIAYLGAADAAGKAYQPATWVSTDRAPKNVTIAGVPVTVLATPGHTPGATAYVIEAHDKGKPVKLFVSGGSSMQAAVPLIRDYLDSMERTYALVKGQKIDSASNPHVYWDGSVNLVKKIQAEGLRSPSQFIIGNEKLLRGGRARMHGGLAGQAGRGNLGAGMACQRARLSAGDAGAEPPCCAPEQWLGAACAPAGLVPGQCRRRCLHGHDRCQRRRDLSRAGRLARRGGPRHGDIRGRNRSRHRRPGQRDHGNGRLRLQ